MLKHTAGSTERTAELPHTASSARRSLLDVEQGATTATALRSRSTPTRQCLFAHAQTIVDIDPSNSVSPQLVGAELLARWVTENGTVLYPNQFLPLIEELDLAFAFDDRMLRSAAALLTEPEAAKALDFVSVNIGADHLSTPRLCDSVEGIIAKSGIAPERLVLEVTEVADHDTGPWRENITRLDALGVRVAIDDFGAGFSSMARLIEAPVSIVKIDRTLVEHIDDPGCRALLSGLVAYAAESGTALIAEGIETQDQASRLIDLGICRHQGYLYGRPAPLEQLRRRIAPRRVDWDTDCQNPMAAAG